MPLGTRELLLIIRARDEASRALHSMTRSMRNLDEASRRAAEANIERGRALSSLGVGITAVGLGGAAALASWTQAAIKYNQESAKTLTQVDKQKASLEDIRQIGIRVARDIPAPFEQMQETLFSIFSSMDTNLKESEHLLKEFSRAAVAGQVDLKDAARGTIGILNAYRMEAKDVNRVNDVMFELVRKGVGTYAEFSKVMGRAVPSAVRAGQSIENLAGMMAFLTRNGLSTAMAASSAARALDAFSHPATIGRMEEFGEVLDAALGKDRQDAIKAMGIDIAGMSIAVKDSAGNFRPMNDVMTDMGKLFEDMKLTAPEAAAVLQQLFKGSGGTIQARRFFDIALKNYKELNSLTGSMRKSSGAMQKAYDIMFKQPQTQIQLLKNNYEILKVEVGQALIPVLLKLVEHILKVVNWFNKLSPTTKKWIGYILLAASVLLILIGAVVAVAGAIMMFVGGLAAAGFSAVAFGAVMGVIIATLVAFGTMAHMVIKHWDVWKGYFTGFWNWLSSTFSAGWNFIKNLTINTLNAIVNHFKSWFNFIVNAVKIGMAVVLATWIIAWKLLGEPIVRFFKWAWEIISIGIKAIWTVLKTGLNAWLAFFKFIWGELRKPIMAFWNWIAPYLRTATGFVGKIIKSAWDSIYRVTSDLWRKISGGFKNFWNGVTGGFRSGKSSITGIWNSIKGPMAGPANFIIDKVWNKGIARAWNTAASIVNLPNKFRAPTVGLIKAASGGYISGPGTGTSDDIPAMLSNGEYVVKASKTKQWLPFLHAINNGLIKRGAIPGFKEGGLVDKIKGGFKFMADVFMNPGGAIKKLLTMPLDMMKGIGAGAWGELVKAIPRGMVDFLSKGFISLFKKYGGGNGAGVVNAAKKYLGVGDDRGMDNNNMFTRHYGWPAGTPWCALFVSKAVEDAKAQKYYKGWPTAAVAGYNGAMKHVASNMGRPGDLAAYGSNDHINIIEERLGSGRVYRTIGGNEGPKVKRGIRGGGRILRPGFARGGLVDLDVFKERNFDNRDRHNPLTGLFATLADDGGYLRPGLNVFMNKTGGGERILDHNETQAYEAGVGRAVQVVINTQEINPRKHAADLGWEISRRVT